MYQRITMKLPPLAIFFLLTITLCFIVGLVTGDTHLIIVSGISLLLIFVFAMCLDAQSNKNS